MWRFPMYKKRMKHRTWKYLGEGWDRVAYLVDNHVVVKVPKDERGEECNVFESMNWNLSDGECVQTRLIKINGMDCAVQPYLRDATPDETPEWASYYDGGQGGINRHGRYQIYDFPPDWMGNAALFMDY